MDSNSALFDRFAKRAARAAGHSWAFIACATGIIIWAGLGPAYGFSDTWQLVANTVTTLLTSLMVFLIQNTQNRDAEAIQIKLDELIRATRGAHKAFLDLEELAEDDLDKIRQIYSDLAKEAREGMRRGMRDTGTPHLPEPNAE